MEPQSAGGREAFRLDKDRPGRALWWARHRRRHRRRAIRPDVLALPRVRPTDRAWPSRGADCARHPLCRGPSRNARHLRCAQSGTRQPARAGPRLPPARILRAPTGALSGALPAAREPRRPDRLLPGRRHGSARGRHDRKARDQADDPCRSHRVAERLRRHRVGQWSTAAHGMGDLRRAAS